MGTRFVVDKTPTPCLRWTLTSRKRAWQERDISRRVAGPKSGKRPYMARVCLLLARVIVNVPTFEFHTAALQGALGSDVCSSRIKFGRGKAVRLGCASCHRPFGQRSTARLYDLRRQLRFAACESLCASSVARKRSALIRQATPSDDNRLPCFWCVFTRCSPCQPSQQPPSP